MRLPPYCALLRRGLGGSDSGSIACPFCVHLEVQLGSGRQSCRADLADDAQRRDAIPLADVEGERCA